MIGGCLEAAVLCPLPKLTPLLFLELFYSILNCTLSTSIGKGGGTNVPSFAVCCFRRDLRLSLNIILLNLLSHANLCSLSNFGHFFAMLFYKTKTKIDAAVTENFGVPNTLIVLKPILFLYLRTVVAWPIEVSFPQPPWCTYKKMPSAIAS